LADTPPAQAFDICTTDADCSGHGTCVVATGVCNCESGFITPTTGGAQCAYEQKSQHKAIWLQTCCGALGAAEYYVGNYDVGTKKLLLTSGAGVAIIGGYALAFIAGFDRRPGAGLAAFVLVPVGLAAAITSFGWYVVDDLMFAFNFRTDGNGQLLKPRNT
jgi:hypothetical protein